MMTVIEYFEILPKYVKNKNRLYLYTTYKYLKSKLVSLNKEISIFHKHRDHKRLKGNICVSNEFNT